MAEPVRDVPIRDESIRLGQFLKLANLIDIGSDAKAAISGGEVTVNDDVETRRGRQLRNDWERPSSQDKGFARQRARTTKGWGTCRHWP
jgi:ribosome-associated protein